MAKKKSAERGPKPHGSGRAIKKAMIAAVAKSGRIGQSCRKVGVARRTHYDWVGSDEEYAEAIRDAREEYVDNLEAEADRRAVEGTLRPVYQGGEEVGAVREYSDTLLIFRLKGERPEKYRERQSVEHSGPGGSVVSIHVARQSLLENKALVDAITADALGETTDHEGDANAG